MQYFVAVPVVVLKKNRKRHKMNKETKLERRGVKFFRQLVKFTVGITKKMKKASQDDFQTYQTRTIQHKYAICKESHNSFGTKKEK